MTQENSAPPPAKTASQGAGQLLADLGPTILFVVSYNVLQRIESTADNAVYIATSLFIAATLIAIAYAKLKTGRVPPVLIVTGVIVTAFGGLTIALHDENFVKLKPTVANFFYATALTVSVLIKQNVWKLLFRHLFDLPDRIWDIAALRWAAFFFCMGITNEIMRNTMSTSDWVTWHFPVLYIPTLLFAAANTPLLLKHLREEPKDEAPPAPGA